MRTGKICGAVWEAQAVNRHIQGVDQNCFFCNVTLLKWRIGLDCLADPHHMIRLHQMNPKANQIHIFRYTKIFHKKWKFPKDNLHLSLQSRNKQPNRRQVAHHLDHVEEAWAPLPQQHDRRQEFRNMPKYEFRSEPNPTPKLLTGDGCSTVRSLFSGFSCISTLAKGLAAIWRISFITARRWSWTSHIVLS